MQFPTGGKVRDPWQKAGEKPACLSWLTRCKSGTNSKVWMKEENLAVNAVYSARGMQGRRSRCRVLSTPDHPIRGYFARISRVRNSSQPKPCSHGRRQKRVYDEQRERGKRSFPSLLIRKSRVRNSSQPKPCSHGRRQKRVYDEQRERGKRSFPSLLIRKSRVRNSAQEEFSCIISGASGYQESGGAGNGGKENEQIIH